MAHIAPQRWLAILIVSALLPHAARGTPGAARILEVWSADPALLDVQVISASGRATDARVGLDVAEADRIRTGYQCRAKIDFGGKATVVIDELSECRVGLFKVGDHSQVELWLKAGEVQAQVRREAAVRTSFVVKTPTATASVRGTWLAIIYTLDTGMKITRIYNGSLLVATLSGAKSAVNQGERANVDKEGNTITDNAKIVSVESRTVATPEGLTPEEKRATENQPIRSTTTVEVAAAGTSSDSVQAGVEESTKPPPTSGPKGSKEGLLHLLQEGLNFSSGGAGGGPVVSGDAQLQQASPQGLPQSLRMTSLGGTTELQRDPPSRLPPPPPITLLGMHGSSVEHDNIHATGNFGLVAQREFQDNPSHPNAVPMRDAVDKMFQTLDPHDWMHARMEHHIVFGGPQAPSDVTAEHDMFHGKPDAHAYTHELLDRGAANGVSATTINNFHERFHEAFGIPK